jgi:hypothetical protein
MAATRWQEWKSFVKSSLTESDQFKQFVSMRDELKKRGQTERQAWAEAAKMFAMPSVDEFKEKKRNIQTPPEDKGLESDGRVPAEFFRGKDCPIQQTVHWVSQNIAIKDVDPHSCPSPQAWGMLKWCQTHPQNESEFWKSIYPKWFPSRAQLDQEAKLKEDGGTIELIDRVMEWGDDARKETADVDQDDEWEDIESPHRSSDRAAG